MRRWTLVKIHSSIKPDSALHFNESVVKNRAPHTTEEKARKNHFMPHGHLKRAIWTSFDMNLWDKCKMCVNVITQAFKGL